MTGTEKPKPQDLLHYEDGLWPEFLAEAGPGVSHGGIGRFVFDAGYAVRATPISGRGAPRVKLEADDLPSYPEELQKKLTRVFPEPPRDYLVPELMRQLKLLLKQLGPAWEARADQKEKTDARKKRHAEVAESLAKLLRSAKKGREVPAVSVEKKEIRHRGLDDEEPQVEFLVPGPGDKLADGKLSVDREDGSIEVYFHGNVSQAVAAALAEALAPFVVPRVQCKGKGRDRCSYGTTHAESLTEPDDRREGRCDWHQEDYLRQAKKTAKKLAGEPAEGDDS